MCLARGLLLSWSEELLLFADLDRRFAALCYSIGSDLLVLVACMFGLALFEFLNIIKYSINKLIEQIN
jgi:hypothetical protein